LISATKTDVVLSDHGSLDESRIEGEIRPRTKQHEGEDEYQDFLGREGDQELLICGRNMAHIGFAENYRIQLEFVPLPGASRIALELIEH